MLIKDKTFMIHLQIIQSLAIEIYDAADNLLVSNLREFFIINNPNYNLRFESELFALKLSTAFKEQNSVSFLQSLI